jgi:hypothetical protein
MVELADHFEMFMFYMDRRAYSFPGHADLFFVDLTSGTDGTGVTYDESDEDL